MTPVASEFCEAPALVPLSLLALGSLSPPSQPDPKVEEDVGDNIHENIGMICLLERRQDRTGKSKSTVQQITWVSG